MAASILPELEQLERLAADASPLATLHELGHAGEPRWPLLALCLGNSDPALPAVGFFGGMHGIERIGSQVLLVYLQSVIARLRWDSGLHRQLERMRLVFMPVVNPGGMAQSTRCNPRGVDLMRNAPIDAAGRVPPLLGGQRWSRRLPWFRGEADAPMEAESHAVCELVQRELFGRPFSLVLDCHSGFGMHGRIWFPYARSSEPLPHAAEMRAIESLFSKSCPTHDYVFEPQSRQYLTHGDLWDHLYLNALRRPARIFLPLTLEMGSWRWVKKSPWQLFLRCGIFNPLPFHRAQRVLRRHLVWLDFLARAAADHRHWLPIGAERERLQAHALRRWYACHQSGAPA